MVMSAVLLSSLLGHAAALNSTSCGDRVQLDDCLAHCSCVACWHDASNRDYAHCAAGGANGPTSPEHCGRALYFTYNAACRNSNASPWTDIVLPCLLALLLLGLCGAVAAAKQSCCRGRTASGYSSV